MSIGILELLRADGSMIINKKLAKAIGIDAAIMYSEIISKHMYFENREQLTDDGYFFNTIVDMEDSTTLTEYQQRKSIKVLEEKGLIKVARRGLPQKRYFMLNTDATIVLNLMSIQPTSKTEKTKVNNLKNSSIKTEKTQDLKPKKPQDNNTNTNNTNNNTNKDNINMPKQAKAGKTGSLFDIGNNTQGASDKKATKPKDIASEKITLARQTKDWSALNYRDFGYLFAELYEKHYGLKCMDFDMYAAGTIKKFMNSYKIAHNDFEQTILNMFSAFDNSSLKNDKFFSFTLNSLKQEFIINEVLLGCTSSTKRQALDRFEQQSKEDEQRYQKEAEAMGVTRDHMTEEVF